MAITQRRMTLEEFDELPEEKPALELRHGTVTQKVSPEFIHGRLQYKFAEQINRIAEPRQLGMAVPEVRMSADGDSVVPDVSFFRWERIPRDERGRIAGHRFREPPDVAIEIRSPGQGLHDMFDKCRWMAEHGVPIVILVDTYADRAFDFRAGREERELRGSDAIDLNDALPGFQLTVDGLFGWLE